MKVGVIGGTGLTGLADSATLLAPPQTPYGDAATPWGYADLPNAVFINRHGDGHVLLPHEINYRANLWLLRELEVEAVFAVLTVGGIAHELAAGDFTLPHQIIDYTWGRAHTYSSGSNLLHADFTWPFTPDLRARLASAAAAADVPLHDGGVYGCTQGPRLETAAEIDRMAGDGCTVVGMTAMPEAALARELKLPYVGLCMVVNPAAGRGGAEIIEVADMRKVVAQMHPKLMRILRTFLAD